MDMRYLPFAIPGLPQIGCAFSTRLGGNSSGAYDALNISFDVGDDPDFVRANRKALFGGLGPKAIHEQKQVHGTQIIMNAEETSIDAPGTIEADGSATMTPGLGLVVKTADCQPILMAHKGGKHVAALHVGWRGNVLNLPGLGVAAFCAEYELSPADVLIVRGPSLGPAAAEFTNFDLEFGDAFRPYFDSAGKTVDLWRLTRDQLAAAGVEPTHIYALDLCTHSLPELFFSYRRDKVCGRMASVIWIRND
jgi:hypothetical protein